MRLGAGDVVFGGELFDGADAVGFVDFAGLVDDGFGGDVEDFGDLAEGAGEEELFDFGEAFGSVRQYQEKFP